MFKVIQSIPEKTVLAINPTETVSVVYDNNKISSVNFHKTATCGIAKEEFYLSELVYTVANGQWDLSSLFGNDWTTSYNITDCIIEIILKQTGSIPNLHIRTVYNIKQQLLSALPTMQFDNEAHNQTVTDLKQLFNIS